MTSPYGTGVVTAYNTNSGNPYINPLTVAGFKWGIGALGVGATVTYSFPSSGAAWIGDYLDSEPFTGFTPFTAAQQNAARQALTTWQEVANITFEEVADTAGDVGDIRFGNTNAIWNTGAAAWAYFPYDDNSVFQWPEPGDVWFDDDYAPNLQLQPGQFGFMALVHEIGHAIGLDHPFVDRAGDPSLPAALDNQRYSIMAYAAYSGATIEAAAPMMFDILAIQYLYGANMATGAGNNVYSFDPNTEYLKVIWDAGGLDRIDLDNQTRAQVIDLREGSFSSIGVKNNGQTAVGNVGIAYGVVIEEARGGSGSDTITGNDAANRLWGGLGNDVMDGGAGADILDGGAGADAMIGGKGDDVYYVDDSGDKVTEALALASGGGSDMVVATASFSLASFANVDNLVLHGTGHINAVGNAIGNVLVGNSGNNFLDGGGSVDVLFGGAGNDIYVVDSLGEVVDEQGNTDKDDELRSATVLLGAVAGIEHYTYSGAAAWTFAGDGLSNRLSGGSAIDTLNGGDGNDTLSGNNGNDILIGGIGDDWLDGGAGNDKMKGGIGNDTYVIDAAGDTVDEEGNADSADLVRASIAVNLATLGGGAIEHATLLGSAALNATGNSLSNTLTGNDGANILDGAGGADILTGGKGNDTYVIDSLSDQVIESADGGLDTVKAGFSLNLASFSNVENLTLTGAAAINGTGNGLANVLTGNDAANILNGGAGADTMIGGKGDDIYYVDDSGDKITESLTLASGGGSDMVVATASLSLASFANVDNLVLQGAGHINAIGNAIGNVLVGNSGNNFLDGGGSADVMFGGAGNDIYVVDSLGEVVDEQGNTDKDDELRSATVLLGAIAGIEHYTYSGAAAWTFAGDGLSNRLSGGSAIDTLNGGDGNDTLSGNNGNDILIGGIGDDWLDGGAGNDKMKGGIGNDTYVIDAAGDTVDEEGNADIADVVRATVSVNLATLAGGAIEHATLLGSAALNATGNGQSNTLTGNDGANILDGAGGADILTGGKGNDTYVIDSLSDQVIESADGGIDTVKAGFSLNLASFSNVENLTLTGAAAINGTGNGLANVLTGNDAANILNGGAGADTMIGGKGDDIYYVDDSGDKITESLTLASGGGSDMVVATASFSLAGFANVDNLVLQGGGHINAIGNAIGNVLVGNSGNNFLDGGGSVDVLFGGAGNDIYVVDSLGEVVDEQGNTDKDDELRSATVLLGAVAGIEHYTYSGAAAWTFAGDGQDNKLSGGSAIDNLNGGAGNDTLLGNGGNDILIGGIGEDWLDGGAGNDKMKGGSGNDTYVVDAAGDTVDEEGNADSADIVRATISVNLVAIGAVGVEQVLLLGANAINAIGNGLVNTLTGNDAANLLDGGGAADILAGGKGNDTYVIDSLSDQVTESADGGIDTVSASFSFGLGSFTNIENLTLTGATAINGTGDGLANVLTGNDGNNILDGGGGADTLIGGKGDDTYLISDKDDVIVELAGGGIDTIVSGDQVLLVNYSNVENAAIVGSGSGYLYGNNSNNTLTGSSGVDQLIGEDGDDRLIGGGDHDTLIGGAGNDYLYGGDWTDSYYLDGSGRDTIDYNHMSEVGDNIDAFTVGSSGDILDLRDLLDDIGYAGSNPFADGYLSTFYNGSWSTLYIDVDGSSGGTGLAIVATLFGTDLGQATSANYIL